MHCEKGINEESLLTEVWLVDPLFIPPSIHQFPPNLSGENNPLFSHFCGFILSFLFHPDLLALCRGQVCK